MAKSNSILILGLAFLTVVMVVPGHSGAAIQKDSRGPDFGPPAGIAVNTAVVPSRGGGSDADMIQFKAGRHVLGFRRDGVFLAGWDHALRVRFLGTEGVKPEST